MNMSSADSKRFKLGCIFATIPFPQHHRFLFSGFFATAISRLAISHGDFSAGATSPVVDGG